MEEGDEFERLFVEYRLVNNRFTFDDLFRSLLQMGLDYEEAKDAICYNCSLSAMIMQERIYNKYYQKISVSEKISGDLEGFRNEILAKWMPPWSFN